MRALIHPCCPSHTNSRAPGARTRGPCFSNPKPSAVDLRPANSQNSPAFPPQPAQTHFKRRNVGSETQLRMPAWKRPGAALLSELVYQGQGQPASEGHEMQIVCRQDNTRHLQPRRFYARNLCPAFPKPISDPTTHIFRQLADVRDRCSGQLYLGRTSGHHPL